MNSRPRRLLASFLAALLPLTSSPALAGPPGLNGILVSVNPTDSGAGDPNLPPELRRPWLVLDAIARSAKSGDTSASDVRVARQLVPQVIAALEASPARRSDEVKEEFRIMKLVAESTLRSLDEAGDDDERAARVLAGQLGILREQTVFIHAQDAQNQPQPTGNSNQTVSNTPQPTPSRPEDRGNGNNNNSAPTATPPVPTEPPSRTLARTPEGREMLAQVEKASVINLPLGLGQLHVDTAKTDQAVRDAKNTNLGKTQEDAGKTGNDASKRSAQEQSREQMAKLLSSHAQNHRFRFALDLAGLAGLSFDGSEFKIDGRVVPLERVERFFNQELPEIPSNAEDPGFGKAFSMADYRELVALYRRFKESGAMPQELKDIELKDVSLEWDRSCGGVDAGDCNPIAAAKHSFYRAGKPVSAEDLRDILAALRRQDARREALELLMSQKGWKEDLASPVLSTIEARALDAILKKDLGPNEDPVKILAKSLEHEIAATLEVGDVTLPRAEAWARAVLDAAPAMVKRWNQDREQVPKEDRARLEKALRVVHAQDLEQTLRKAQLEAASGKLDESRLAALFDGARRSAANLSDGVSASVSRFFATLRGATAKQEVKAGGTDAPNGRTRAEPGETGSSFSEALANVKLSLGLPLTADERALLISRLEKERVARKRDWVAREAPGLLDELSRVPGNETLVADLRRRLPQASADAAALDDFVARLELALGQQLHAQRARQDEAALTADLVKLEELAAGADGRASADALKGFEELRARLVASLERALSGLAGGKDASSDLAQARADYRALTGRDWPQRLDAIVTRLSELAAEAAASAASVRASLQASVGGGVDWDRLGPSELLALLQRIAERRKAAGLEPSPELEKDAAALRAIADKQAPLLAELDSLLSPTSLGRRDWLKLHGASDEVAALADRIDAARASLAANQAAHPSLFRFEAARREHARWLQETGPLDGWYVPVEDARVDELAAANAMPLGAKVARTTFGESSLKRLYWHIDDARAARPGVELRGPDGKDVVFMLDDGSEITTLHGDERTDIETYKQDGQTIYRRRRLRLGAFNPSDDERRKHEKVRGTWQGAPITPVDDEKGEFVDGKFVPRERDEQVGERSGEEIHRQFFDGQWYTAAGPVFDKDGSEVDRREYFNPDFDYSKLPFDKAGGNFVSVPGVDDPRILAAMQRIPGVFPTKEKDRDGRPTAFMYWKDGAIYVGWTNSGIVKRIIPLGAGAFKVETHSPGARADDSISVFKPSGDGYLEDRKLLWSNGGGSYYQGFDVTWKPDGRGGFQYTKNEQRDLPKDAPKDWGWWDGFKEEAFNTTTFKVVNAVIGKPLGYAGKIIIHGTASLLTSLAALGWQGCTDDEAPTFVLVRSEIEGRVTAKYSDEKNWTEQDYLDIVDGALILAKNPTVARHVLESLMSDALQLKFKEIPGGDWDSFLSGFKRENPTFEDQKRALARYIVRTGSVAGWLGDLKSQGGGAAVLGYGIDVTDFLGQMAAGALLTKPLTVLGAMAGRSASATNWGNRAVNFLSKERTFESVWRGLRWADKVADWSARATSRISQAFGGKPPPPTTPLTALERAELVGARLLNAPIHVGMDATFKVQIIADAGAFLEGPTFDKAFELAKQTLGMKVFAYASKVDEVNAKKAEFREKIEKELKDARYKANGVEPREQPELRAEGFKDPASRKLAQQLVDDLVGGDRALAQFLRGKKVRVIEIEGEWATGLFRVASDGAYEIGLSPSLVKRALKNGVSLALLKSTMLHELGVHGRQDLALGEHDINVLPAEYEAHRLDHIDTMDQLLAMKPAELEAWFKECSPWEKVELHRILKWLESEAALTRYVDSGYGLPSVLQIKKKALDQARQPYVEKWSKEAGAPKDPQALSDWAKTNRPAEYAEMLAKAREALAADAKAIERYQDLNDYYREWIKRKASGSVDRAQTLLDRLLGKTPAQDALKEIDARRGQIEVERAELESRLKNEKPTGDPWKDAERLGPIDDKLEELKLEAKRLEDLKKAVLAENPKADPPQFTRNPDSKPPTVPERLAAIDKAIAEARTNHEKIKADYEAGLEAEAKLKDDPKALAALRASGKLTLKSQVEGAESTVRGLEFEKTCLETLRRQGEKAGRVGEKLKQLNGKDNFTDIDAETDDALYEFASGKAAVAKAEKQFKKQLNVARRFGTDSTPKKIIMMVDKAALSEPGMSDALGDMARLAREAGVPFEIRDGATGERITVKETPAPQTAAKFKGPTGTPPTVPADFRGRKPRTIELKSLPPLYQDPGGAARAEAVKRGEIFTLTGDNLDQVKAADLHTRFNYAIVGTPEGGIELVVGRVDEIGNPRESGVKHANLANDRPVYFSGEIIYKGGKIELDFNSGTFSSYGQDPRWEPTPENARALAAFAKEILGRDVVVIDHRGNARVPVAVEPPATPKLMKDLKPLDTSGYRDSRPAGSGNYKDVYRIETSDGPVAVAKPNRKVLRSDQGELAAEVERGRRAYEAYSKDLPPDAALRLVKILGYGTMPLDVVLGKSPAPERAPPGWLDRLLGRKPPPPPKPVVVEAMVMEWIDGQKLADFIKGGGEVSVRDWAALENGLRRLHERWAHGDISADNIMVVKGADGRLRFVLMDYGLMVEKGGKGFDEALERDGARLDEIRGRLFPKRP